MRIKNYIIIILFTVLICAPYLLWPFLNKYFDTKNYENRSLVELPQFTLKSIKEYPSLIEKYINDHLPFRNQLVRLNSFISYYFFHSSTSDYVIVGQNGWLFYARKDDGDPISCYKGTNLLTEEQLLKIKQNVITTKNNLAKLGTEYIIFIAPNRERIYSQYMPYYYGKPAKNYAVRQIVDYLRKTTDIKVIFPIEELRTAANKQLGNDKIIYYKTDTHWNNLGAYIGTCELLKEVGVILPEYNSDIVIINESKLSNGDMAKMLNLSSYIDHGHEYTPTGYNTYNFVTKKKEFRTEYIYHAANADPRKIFVRRDSFCTAMGDILGSQFSKSVMVHRGAYKHEMLKKEHYDIFVQEIVERAAPAQLLGFVYK